MWKRTARQGKGLRAHRVEHEGDRRDRLVEVEEESNRRQARADAFQTSKGSAQRAASAQFVTRGTLRVKQRARMHEAVEKRLRRLGSWAAGWARSWAVGWLLSSRLSSARLISRPGRSSAARAASNEVALVQWPLRGVLNQRGGGRRGGGPV